MLHNNNSHSWAWVTCERIVEVIMNYLLPIICLFIQTHFLIGFNPPDNSSGDYIWKKWAIYNYWRQFWRQWLYISDILKSLRLQKTVAWYLNCFCHECRIQVVNAGYMSSGVCEDEKPNFWTERIQELHIHTEIFTGWMPLASSICIILHIILSLIQPLLILSFEVG